MLSDTRKTYTVKETADLLGVNHKGVYDAVAENRIPHIRLGRRILIPRIAFDNWLKNSQENAQVG